MAQVFATKQTPGGHPDAATSTAKDNRAMRSQAAAGKSATAQTKQNQKKSLGTGVGSPPFRWRSTRASQERAQLLPERGRGCLSDIASRYLRRNPSPFQNDYSLTLITILQGFGACWTQSPTGHKSVPVEAVRASPPFRFLVSVRDDEAVPYSTQKTHGPPRAIALDALISQEQ